MSGHLNERLAAEVARLNKQIRDDEAAMALIREAADLIKKSPLAEQIKKQAMKIAELEAEIARLRAPIGADVTEIAETLLPRSPLGLFKSGREEAVMIVARALQAYGDVRARERGDLDALIKLNEQLGKVNAGLRQKLTDLEFPPDETQ